MIIVTTHQVPGREIDSVVGFVRGSTVRSRNVGRDFLAGMRGVIGGEIKEYTRLQAQSREEALARMVADAEKLGADAIVGCLMSTSMIGPGNAEILVYGTAVKLAG